MGVEEWVSLRYKVIKLPGINGSALFGYLSGTGTRSTGFPFYAVRPGINIVAIPSRHVGGLTRLIGPTRLIPAAIRVISVTNLIGNTSGNRNLNGGFLTGVHRASTVLRILHYFSSSGMIRISNSISPVHSGRVVSTRLRLGSLRAIRSHVRGIRGRTRAKNSGRTGRVCSILIGCGRTLRRNLSTHAIAFSAHSRRGVTRRLFLLATGPILCIYGISRTDTISNGTCIRHIHRITTHRKTSILVMTTGVRDRVTRFRSCRRHRVFLRRVKLRDSNITQLVRTTCTLLGLGAFFATKPGRIHT